MGGAFELDQFPSRTEVVLQERDTDHLGHVNHNVFVNLLETGRIEIFLAEGNGLPSAGCGLVLVSIHIDFLAEVFWPGTVEIGTRITRVGRSSVTTEQGIFQNGKCCATGVTVAAQMNMTSRRAEPMDEAAIAYLKRFVVEST
jgi:acyl-CoA thioester hydrolase